MGLFDFFKKKKDVKAQKYNLGMEKTRKEAIGISGVVETNLG